MFDPTPPNDSAVKEVLNIPPEQQAFFTNVNLRTQRLAKIVQSPSTPYDADDSRVALTQLEVGAAAVRSYFQGEPYDLKTAIYGVQAAISEVIGRTNANSALFNTDPDPVEATSCAEDHELLNGLILRLRDLTSGTTPARDPANGTPNPS